jgi:hypothetical protein
MEFREYYLGVSARIRFDSRTKTYIGDIDAPVAMRFVANSYEELQANLQQTIEELLSGNRKTVDENQTACVKLERVAFVNEG